MGIADPTIRTETAITDAGNVLVTTNNPGTDIVSTNLGSTTANSYPLTGCVTAFGSLVPNANLNGLAFLGPRCSPISGVIPGPTATVADAALSLADFNTFRLRMVDAINVLDEKFREALETAQPTC